MKTTGHGIEDSKDVENMYHMRLMTLLQELVRERGYRGAARALEIDQRTVAESARTGKAVAADAGGPGAGFAVGRWVLRRSASGSPTTPWRNGWGC